MRRVVGFDLQQNQIVFPIKFFRHFYERFPINSLVVNAKAAPIFVVFKNLIEQLIDARASFARAGVAGDKPAATEIFARPVKAFQGRDKFPLYRLIGCSDGECSNEREERRHDPRIRQWQGKESASGKQKRNAGRDDIQESHN